MMLPAVFIAAHVEQYWLTKPVPLKSWRKNGACSLGSWCVTVAKPVRQPSSAVTAHSGIVSHPKALSTVSSVIRFPVTNWCVSGMTGHHTIRSFYETCVGCARSGLSNGWQNKVCGGPARIAAPVLSGTMWNANCAGHRSGTAGRKRQTWIRAIDSRTPSASCNGKVNLRGS
jgi:hypothetical protein